MSELSDSEVDILLERFDQTEPALQRRIVAAFIQKAMLAEAENARLRKSIELLSGDVESLQGQTNEACHQASRLQKRAIAAEQRAERAELLVRLRCRYATDRAGKWYVSTMFGGRETVIYFEQLDTNGIPDLTPEQWEWLFELEKGTT